MANAIERDPLSNIILTNAGLIAYLARDTERAASWCERALELAPGDHGAILLRGLIYEFAGETQAAIAWDRRATELSSRHTMSLATLGHALARGGYRGEAEEILRRLEAMRQTQHVSACDSALVALGLERYDEALDWLDLALEEKSAWLVYLQTDARLDPLRSHARFAHALECTRSGAAAAGAPK
jgi:tetratricopeptide (TPR) repeat protein